MATDDTLVPGRDARRLADSVSAALPRIIEVPGAGHTDVIAIGGEPRALAGRSVPARQLSRRVGRAAAEPHPTSWMASPGRGYGLSFSIVLASASWGWSSRSRRRPGQVGGDRPGGAVVAHPVQVLPGSLAIASMEQLERHEGVGLGLLGVGRRGTRGRTRC